MPEVVTTVESWRAAAPLRFGTTTLLPLERTRRCTWRGAAWTGIVCTFEPGALLLHERGEWRALDVQGEALPIEWLRARFPPLDAVLAGLCPRA